MMSTSIPPASADFAESLVPAPPPTIGRPAATVARNRASAAVLSMAIEGADPRVLAVADRVAADPERAGLVRAFTELGLI